MSWTPPAGAILNRDNLVTPLNASGNGNNQLQNNNSARLWVIVQISVITAPEAPGCTCKLSPPTGIVDTSYFAGTGDVAGGEPYFLFSGDFVAFTWTNGPANGQGLATYFYYEVPL